MADVLGSERPVDGARGDPADPPAFKRVLGSQSPVQDVPDEAARGVAVDPELVAELIAGEHAER